MVVTVSPTQRDGQEQSWLLHSGTILTHDLAMTDQLLVRDGVIAAIGPTAAAAAQRDPAVRHVDLSGCVVTAAFVDAHVHLTATGLMGSGLDLTATRSCAELLTQLRDFASRVHDSIIIGHGWDDSQFDTPGVPTAAQLDEATGGRLVYLTRIDVHSALVSQRALDELPELGGDEGFSSDGLLTRAAHGRVRRHVMAHLTDEQRVCAQNAALRAAAARGVVSVHENGGPIVSSVADLQSAMALGRTRGNPEVIGYWGELGGASTATRIGAHGVAGDLFVDGSLGSHTAYLCQPYLGGESLGACYVAEDELVQHFLESAQANLQAGVHAIGDAAIGLVLRAMHRVGTSGANRWRIEHMEMPSAADIEVAARLGVIASVQPQFDRLWGGPDGMYSQRLGHERACGMNPFAVLQAAGVALAFGSDSPVTPINPWGSVCAAVGTHQVSHGLSYPDAFAAATSGAAAAAPSRINVENELTRAQEQPTTTLRVRSTVAVGQPADLAIWAPLPGHQRAADGSAVLARLAEMYGSPSGDSAVTAVATLRAGDVIHDTGMFR